MFSMNCDSTIEALDLNSLDHTERKRFSEIVNELRNANSSLSRDKAAQTAYAILMEGPASSAPDRS